jgi:hypothetical protein
MSMSHPKVRELVAAVARAQAGDVVDLSQIESKVRMDVLQRAIEEVWEMVDAGFPAERAEQALQLLKGKLIEEIIERPLFTAREENARLAMHRAARGVRKVRGAK